MSCFHRPAHQHTFVLMSILIITPSPTHNAAEIFIIFLWRIYSKSGIVEAPVYLIVSFRHCQITYQRHIAHFLPLATWVPPIPHTFTRTYKPFKTLSNMMNKKCHLIVIVLISLITCVVEHFYGRFGNSDIFFDLPVNCTIRLCAWFFVWISSKHFCLML